MQIIDLTSHNGPAVRQAAELVAELIPPQQPIDEARANVQDCLAPGKVARMVMEDDTLVGWTGGREVYAGHLWELHPLVVRRERQRQGIGQALVADLEEHVRARGAHTVMVAADYEQGIDLYANVLEHLRGIKNVHAYQYEFYERCGYVIVGVRPDASGFSNIYMAKRIVPLTG